MVGPVPRDADWSERLQMSMATRLAAHHEQELRQRAIGRIAMDYDLIALGDGALRPPPAPRAPPTYEAPEPAREGYTRSPDQAEMCVCPNCGDELGKGETEEKRSVFFVKACGHVRSTHLFVLTSPVRELIMFHGRFTAENARPIDKRVPFPRV
jgi:hypothetical protein